MPPSGVAIVLVLAAVLAPGAAASEVRSEQLTRALELASGRTGVDGSCEPDLAAWDTEARSVGARSGDTLYGYTFITAGRARFAPWVCEHLSLSSPRFGWALNVVASEAARLAGERDEGVAGCWGVLVAADLARRVWRVPFFTARSWAIVAQAVELHRRFAAAAYRTICA